MLHEKCLLLQSFFSHCLILKSSMSIWLWQHQAAISSEFCCFLISSKSIFASWYWSLGFHAGTDLALGWWKLNYDLCLCNSFLLITCQNHDKAMLGLKPSLPSHNLSLGFVFYALAGVFWTFVNNNGSQKWSLDTNLSSSR